MASARVGLGLSTQQHARSSGNPPATAPASPTDPSDEAMHIEYEQAPPSETTATSTHKYTLPPDDATVGSFELEDAIQETVVTTTTRTRISLPPLISRAPKNLRDRDPRQYVLAREPTPAHLQKIQFEHHGRTVTLHESENPAATVQSFQDRSRQLKENNGTIRKEVRQDNYETPVRGGRPEKLSTRMEGSGVKRSFTPHTATNEAMEMESLERKIKRPRARMHRTQSGLSELPSLNQNTATAEFAGHSNPSPITPDTESGAQIAFQPRAGASRLDGTRRRPANLPGRQRMHMTNVNASGQQDDDNDVQMADNESQEDDSQMGPPLYGKHRNRRTVYVEDESAVAGASQASAAATATPPVMEDGREPVPGTSRAGRLAPPLPATMLTSSQLDASLPSPSLSPITAAANAASRNHNHFEDSFAENNDENASVVSGLDLDEESKTQGEESLLSRAAAKASSAENLRDASSIQGLTIKDIPAMIDVFDGMPEALQSYVMHQLLRRCTKKTLQTVADVVNPALKVDPFDVLPTELRLNVTQFLDAQTLCSAAQVSKSWRTKINSDETTWRDLLDRDEFVLPKDEIARAVREGWGWQHPGKNGFEQDLSKHLRNATPEPMAMADVQSTAVSEDDETASSVTTRTKRKSAGKSNNSKKNHKRRPAQPSSSVAKASTTVAPWRHALKQATGPNICSRVAVEAIPKTTQHPAMGSSDLRNMHLFKSIYQRHYLIRKAWMDANAQPHHLAFRAHHRHVVTCLLFDSDKILTGSDDTKICVYDTKTGALRNRLEGHEGGVWALQYEGDTLVSGSTDRSVRVWDIKSGRCLQVFQGHTSTVRCLVILQPVQIDTDADGQPVMMPKEPLIITGSRDSTLRVWKLPQPGEPKVFQAGPPSNDRDNPYYLRTLSGHHNSVRAIAAHGDTLISGSYDCTVRVWKISTGDLVHRLTGHGQKVYSVVLDHARNRCISGSMDNLVKVWDLVNGQCLYNLEGHSSLVGLLDLSNDRLVSAAADSTLRIWDPDSGICKHTLTAHTGAITCFQHDGQKVISGSDRTLKMWNVQNGECVRDLLTDLSGVWQVRFDERRCVAAVQRNNYTYIEVLDFGAARDGVPAEQRGQRIFVDTRGRETVEVEANTAAQQVDNDAGA